MSDKESLSMGIYTNKSENVMFSNGHELYYNFHDIGKLFVLMAAIIGGFLILYLCFCVCCNCKKNNKILPEEI